MASNRWLESFRRRHSIFFFNSVWGESAIVCEEYWMEWKVVCTYGWL
jgi:hypothetical protein